MLCASIWRTPCSPHGSMKRGFISSAFSSIALRSLPLLLVRTNDVHSKRFVEDVEACVWSSLHAIALPKVGSAKDVHQAIEAIDELEQRRGLTAQLGVLPTIESAKGLRLAHEIASSSPRVIGLQIGFADLLAPLGIASEDLSLRQQIRLDVRLAAAEANLDAYDSVFADFRDAAGHKVQLEAARSVGFAGASCIHPSQVAATNEVFTPTKEEIAHARRVLQAADDAAAIGSAVTSLDGKMIDRPFLLQARRVLGREAFVNGKGGERA